jgi:gamma-glutamylcyclotransferase (GGCT)/AIG2-like uncharacterized protein YtfP
LPANARPALLFLYGSLMRGQSAHRLLRGRATFVDEATVAGTLLDLGRFPGVVAGRGRVRGEVWRFEAPEVLRTLDEYEGYNFERRTTTATLASGRRVRAWLYRYRPRATASTFTVVPEGDWRRHRWR